MLRIIVCIAALFMMGLALLIWGLRASLRWYHQGVRVNFWMALAQRIGLCLISRGLSITLMALAFFCFPILKQLWVPGVGMGFGLVLVILTMLIPIQEGAAKTSLHPFQSSEPKKVDRRADIVVIVLRQISFVIVLANFIFFSTLLHIKLFGW